MAFFSIIVPLYNKAQYIKQTLASVLEQDYPHFEIIVVDDGSTDSSLEVVKSVADSRIRCYSKDNGGVSSARNYGIGKAGNDWLLFLDADDELAPHALSVFAGMIEKFPKQRLFVGRCVRGLDELQRNVQSCKVSQSHSPYMDLWLRRFSVASGNVVQHISVIREFGLFDERQSFFEDYDFALRMMQCGSLVYTNQPIRIYHQMPEGLSLSRHRLEREMAYYIPEMRPRHFFYKCLLYENLEHCRSVYPHTEDELRCYETILKECFSSFVFRLLHNIRQRLINHHII